MEDTLDSIKSIDWVLFAPHGIRSYFAKPFYTEQGLHAILILASLRPGSFGADGVANRPQILLKMLIVCSLSIWPHNSALSPQDAITTATELWLTVRQPTKTISRAHR